MENKFHNYERHLENLLKRIENSRFIVSAATGSGKSEIIALAISLLALLGKGEKIAVVSHTRDQSEIIFSKAKKHYDFFSVFHVVRGRVSRPVRESLV